MTRQRVELAKKSDGKPAETSADQEGAITEDTQKSDELVEQPDQPNEQGSGQIRDT